MKTIGYVVNSSDGLLVRSLKDGQWWKGGSNMVYPLFLKRAEAYYQVLKIKKEWKDHPYCPKRIYVSKITGELK